MQTDGIVTRIDGATDRALVHFNRIKIVTARENIRLDERRGRSGASGTRMYMLN